MELVRRVTGHKATEVVLMNYFKPGREEFSIAINEAMPALLTAGDAEKPPKPPATPEEEALEIWQHRDAEDVEARHASRCGPDHANVAGIEARDHPRRIDGRSLTARSRALSLHPERR